jgi:hypothetical protein
MVVVPWMSKNRIRFAETIAATTKPIARRMDGLKAQTDSFRIRNVRLDLYFMDMIFSMLQFAVGDMRFSLLNRCIDSVAERYLLLKQTEQLEPAHQQAAEVAKSLVASDPASCHWGVNHGFSQDHASAFGDRENQPKPLR